MARLTTKLQRRVAIFCIVFASLLFLVWIYNNEVSTSQSLYTSETRSLWLTRDGIDFSRRVFVPDRRSPAAITPDHLNTPLVEDDHELVAHYQHYRVFIIPYWLAIGALLILPAALLASSMYRNRLEAFRKRSGLCVACGYNIAMTPTRCPECGTAVEQKGGAGEGRARGTASRVGQGGELRH